MFVIFIVVNSEGLEVGRMQVVVDGKLCRYMQVFMCD